MKRTRLWMIAAILIICGTAAFASCTANDDNPWTMGRFPGSF